RYVTFGDVLHEARTQVIVESDAPRRTGRDLFSGDETIVEPAMQGRGRDAERLRGALDRHALRLVGLRRSLAAWNVPVRAQTAQTIGSERQACSGLASLTIEDAGDDGIRIMRCQATQQIDRVLGGANRRRVRARQGNVDLARESATPAQHQVGVGLLALNAQSDLLEQRAQQFLAIPIARRGHRPDALEILAEREDRVALLAREGMRSRMLSIRELYFGGLQFPQSAFPLRFESTRDEPIVGIDRAITPFGAQCAVTRALELAPELREDGLVIGLELLDGLQRG